MPTQTHTHRILRTEESATDITIYGSVEEVSHMYFVVKVSTVDQDPHAWSAVAVVNGNIRREHPMIPAFVRFLDEQGYDLEVAS